MEQPHGYEKKGGEGKVYKLKKALYGLKQAPRAWKAKLDRSLISFGLKDATKGECCRQPTDELTLRKAIHEMLRRTKSLPRVKHTGNRVWDPGWTDDVMLGGGECER